MREEYESELRKQLAQRRSITNYGMGAFFVLLGLLFLLHKKLGFEFGNQLPAVDLGFGIMCLVYGGWRMYRGYKKDYFK